ncbi:unnamed protein product [Lactuca virosa]|uniref:Uncharacterized protein n=1 Tax=Lactuca virosa TaxID=75947 RepID=A0AAU9NG22_9ASTR|nr:unnamed protein product [Lactuca virosa]
MGSNLCAIRTDEVNNDIQKGFNSWGNGKKYKNNREGLQGQNGNSATENAFYHSLAECHASSSPVASQSNSSAAPGPDVKLLVVVATVQAAVAEEPQVAPAASPNPTVVPVVNYENSSAYAANSGSLQIGTYTSNKHAPVGFLGGYIRMSGIQSTDDSLSHLPGF